MLRVENLSIRRGGKTVLEGLELELRPGEMLGVLGPNGAGKSTLLGALCGELEPAEGLVLLDERGLDDWPGVARAQRLAVLPQSSSLGFAFPVEAVVGFGRLPHSSGRERDVQIVAEALAAADASHLAGRSYLALSGGERQRVHLARVLAQLWPGVRPVAAGSASRRCVIRRFVPSADRRALPGSANQATAAVGTGSRPAADRKRTGECAWRLLQRATISG